MHFPSIFPKGLKYAALDPKSANAKIINRFQVNYLQLLFSICDSYAGNGWKPIAP